VTAEPRRRRGLLARLRRPATTRGERALAVVLGAILACSATFGARPALAFTFAPALMLLLEHRAPCPRRGLLLGLAAGFGCNAVAFAWIASLLEAFAYFPMVAAVPAALLFALAHGSALAGVGWLGETARRAGMPSWLVLPAALTVAASWWPSLFPWRHSAALPEWPAWAQLAEIGGAPLLDFLLALGGCAGVQALKTPRPGSRRAVPASVAVLALLGPPLYGTVRLPEVAAERALAPVLRVGIVQPNVSIQEKHDPALRHPHLLQLREMTRDLEARGADVVVWPETAYPYPLPRHLTRDLRGGGAILAGGVRGPVLAGAITQASRCDRWNSVVAIDRGGEVRGISDKVELLQFGETVPLWDVLPPLQHFFPCPGLRAADAPSTLTLGGARFGILNCYEDVLAEHARRVARQSPDLLVNVTNDAWFGDTREPHLHQLVARLRTIETRRDLVRAVNTGVSSHVLATGETAVETDTWTRDSFVAEVRLLAGETPWTRFGDLLSPLLALLLVIGAAWHMRHGRM